MAGVNLVHDVSISFLTCNQKIHKGFVFASSMLCQCLYDGRETKLVSCSRPENEAHTTIAS